MQSQILWPGWPRSPLGYNPSPFFLPDTRIRFGLLVVPVLVFGFTMLVYVAVVRCRYLVSGYLPPGTSPVPSETS